MLSGVPTVKKILRQSASLEDDDLCTAARLRGCVSYRMAVAHRWAAIDDEETARLVH
jgi:uncharacterized protein YutE (UPF0331/DUF86 family)